MDKETTVWIVSAVKESNFHPHAKETRIEAVYTDHKAAETHYLSLLENASDDFPVILDKKVIKNI